MGPLTATIVKLYWVSKFIIKLLHVLPLGSIDNVDGWFHALPDNVWPKKSAVNELSAAA